MMTFLLTVFLSIILWTFIWFVSNVFEYHMNFYTFSDFIIMVLLSGLFSVIGDWIMDIGE